MSATNPVAQIAKGIAEMDSAGITVMLAISDSNQARRFKVLAADNCYSKKIVACASCLT